MMVLSLREAAERAETSKIDIWRAIQAGKLLAERTEDGGFAIDPAELFRAFELQRPNERPMADEVSERPEANATIGAASANDWAVTLSAFAAYLKSHVEQPGGTRATDAMSQNEEAGPEAELAEQAAQRAEVAHDRANAGRAIAGCAALQAPAEPWWRRLIGLARWIRTRRGRAARMRLRERL